METKITQLAKQAVQASSQRSGSGERVSAFLAHSRVMVALCQAGQKSSVRSRRG